MAQNLFGTTEDKLKIATGIIACGDCIPEGYLLKPYLCGNENQSHIQGLIKPEYENACVVASSGNTVFEVVRNGITDITAVDVNELQILIFKLRLASALALNNVEFERFLLDLNFKGFLSFETYEKLIKRRIKDVDTANFWSELLKFFPNQVIATSFVKGGLERTDIYNCKRMLPWLKNGGNYNAMRRNLMKAKIEIQICDIIEYLLRHPNLEFDYIDFSNILLYIYQEGTEQNYKKVSEALDNIKRIFEKNLKNGGTFAIDYMFGINKHDLLASNIKLNSNQRLLRDLYFKVYNELSKEFPLETIEIAKAGQATPLNGSTDMILVARK